MNPEALLTEIKHLQSTQQQLRLDVTNFREQLHHDIQHIKNELQRLTTKDETVREVKREFPYIGHIKSCFIRKNGTPRQPSICPYARGELSIKYFNNPHHSLEGLQHFSHIWLMFAFHENGTMRARAKVKPPRLDGQRTGVFSTRSPHRPAPLGLTLAKLDGISGGTLHLSGLDLIDGTPILDIKPYIEQYDYPTGTIYSAPWIDNPPIKELSVVFSDEAGEQLDCLQYSCNRGGSETTVNNCTDGASSEGKFSTDGVDSGQSSASVTKTGVNDVDVNECRTVKKRRLLFMRNKEELSHCITEILRADPRSTYRRGGGGDKQYQDKFKHLIQGGGEERREGEEVVVVGTGEGEINNNVEVNSEVNSEVRGEVSTNGMDNSETTVSGETTVSVTNKVNVFSFPVDNVEVHVKVVESVATVLTVQHTVYVNSLWGEEEGEEGKSRTKRRRRRRKKKN